MLKFNFDSVPRASSKSTIPQVVESTAMPSATPRPGVLSSVTPMEIKDDFTSTDTFSEEKNAGNLHPVKFSRHWEKLDEAAEITEPESQVLNPEMSAQQDHLVGEEDIWDGLTSTFNEGSVTTHLQVAVKGLTDCLKRAVELDNASKIALITVQKESENQSVRITEFQEAAKAWLSSFSH